MKTIKLLIALSVLLAACQKDTEHPATVYQCSPSFADSSPANPKNAQYQQLLAEITRSGIPGIMMAVKTPTQGMWVGAAGKADLASGIDMQPCNTSRMGSTVKTFTAVAVLQLYEEGKLNLDDKINRYLPADVLDGIENAQQATIEQLLRHSSGIYNYIQNAQFQTASLNDLKKVWQPDDLLHYARHQKAYFAPGTDVQYSNTGYILLGMIIEKIEGKPFYEVFQQKIFTPLGLSKTRFAATDPIPAGLVQGYADLYSKHNVINSTQYSGWDYNTADGGLISNPYDMAVFMEKLFSGQLLAPTTLNTMLSWQTPKSISDDFYPIHFGLGIFKIETPHGIAYMHSGDAIGYYATMLYFPVSQTTVVWAVNGNYGKLDEYSSTKNAYDKILSTVF